jgi:hypothetical protein
MMHICTQPLDLGIVRAGCGYHPAEKIQAAKMLFTRREFFDQYPDHGLGAVGRVAASFAVALSVMRLCELGRF